MTQQKSKFKTWHKIVLGIIIVGVIGNLLKDDVNKETASIENKQPLLTPAQEDSIGRVKTIEKGRTEAIVNLRVLISKNLNDPNSFEVIDQKTWVAGETIVVMIDYTAKNGFGGVVRNNLKAEADIYGNLTKVFDN